MRWDCHTEFSDLTPNRNINSDVVYCVFSFGERMAVMFGFTHTHTHAQSAVNAREGDSDYVTFDLKRDYFHDLSRATSQDTWPIHHLFKPQIICVNFGTVEVRMRQASGDVGFDPYWIGALFLSIPHGCLGNEVTRSEFGRTGSVSQDRSCASFDVFRKCVTVAFG